jgi:hypothetical protein
VLSETGEGKVFEEWVGEASVFGFEILPRPEINLDHQECRFHDRGETVAWKIQVFFEKTRQLTLAVRALMEFESILKLVQVRFLVATLWGNLASASLRSPQSGT